MAFGDQINRQICLTGKYHECKHSFEQYAVTCHPQYLQNAF